jgi:hypothetical protein
MGQNVDKPQEMKHIQTWEDVVPFASRIVAYTTETHYYNGNNPLSISVDGKVAFLSQVNSSDVQFAYIREKPPYPWTPEGERYSMSRLIKSHSVPRGCPIWNTILEEHPMKMRLATSNEMTKILIMIESEQATFEYMFSAENILKKLFDAGEAEDHKQQPLPSAADQKVDHKCQPQSVSADNVFLSDDC